MNLIHSRSLARYLRFEGPRLSPASDVSATDAIIEELRNEADPKRARRLRSRAITVAGTQAERIRVSELLAEQDPNFCALVSAADGARDRQAWGEAEFLYWQALALYPYCAGYRVQYAHMLKEKGLAPDAELQYRSALALGAPRSEVEEHLNFVCRGRNIDVTIPRVSGLDAPLASMAQPANIVDIETLELVFFQKPLLTLLDKLFYLRRGASCKTVALGLIQHESFIFRNQKFLELLVDRINDA